MISVQPLQVHGTCISQDGAGILIRGASGAGKSDLALRLISHGAYLIADDRVSLNAHKEQIIASAPKSLLGLIEVRGVGILHLPPSLPAPLRLVVDLVEHDDLERLPESVFAKVLGINIKRIELWAFESSAISKVILALDLALNQIIREDG